MTMDLPAPVSPVSDVKAALKQDIRLLDHGDILNVQQAKHGGSLLEHSGAISRQNSAADILIAHDDERRIVSGQACRPYSASSASRCSHAAAAPRPGMVLMTMMFCA